MDGKTKDSLKTKDILRQLQGEVRQLQALIAEKPSEPTHSEKSEKSKKTAKEKSEFAVEYRIRLSAPGNGEGVGEEVAATLTRPRLRQVTDEAAAGIGYALSSPQKVGLLRALLDKDSESAAALGAATSLSTGSLYHHLRDLMHAGLIGQSGRNRYLLTECGQRTLWMMLALACEES